jgi:hypothetical protein
MRRAQRLVNELITNVFMEFMSPQVFSLNTLER